MGRTNKKLLITAIQSEIFWEDVEKNLDHFSFLISNIQVDTDVVVLSEMFISGFSMNVEKIAQENGGFALEWMQGIAKKHNIAITGSMAVRYQGHFYNRLYWVMPDGSFSHYDKRHLFRMADEDKAYTAGNGRLIIEYKGFRICPMICYDLRFPVWSRNVGKDKNGDLTPIYDCLIYIANWPAPRSDAWEKLLQARAIENLAYVIGVNRIGQDGNEVAYDGKSRTFDFKGGRIDDHVGNEQSICTTEINLDLLNSFREKFPTYLDGDRFNLKY